MRWTNTVLIVASLLYTSCDLIEPEFDNPLDVQNNVPPALLISPEDYTSSIGHDVEISVHALAVEGIAGMRAQINYDDTMLKLLKVSPGTFFDITESPLFVHDDAGCG